MWYSFLVSKFKAIEASRENWWMKMWEIWSKKRLLYFSQLNEKRLQLLQFFQLKKETIINKYNSCCSLPIVGWWWTRGGTPYTYFCVVSISFGTDRNYGTILIKTYWQIEKWHIQPSNGGRGGGLRGQRMQRILGSFIRHPIRRQKKKAILPKIIYTPTTVKAPSTPSWNHYSHFLFSKQ